MPDAGASPVDAALPASDATTQVPSDAGAPTTTDAAAPTATDAAAPITTDASTPSDAGAVTFAPSIVDATLKGPAYAQLVDWDGDGRLDVLVSSFGKAGAIPTSLPNGSVALFRADSTFSSWTKTELVEESANIKFPNEPTVVDVDGDGDRDLVLPYGFLACAAIPGGGPCGGLAWFERQGTTLVRHDIVSAGAALFYHRALFLDVDGDGVKDLVTVGEEKTTSFFGGGTQRAVPQWFKGNASANRFESTPRGLLAANASGLGSLPELHDVDGDGDQDLVSAEYFVDGGSFAWLENPGPAGANGGWTRRVLRSDTGPAIQFSVVPGLLGAGTVGYVGTNHTNTGKTPPDSVAEAVFSFAKPSDVRTPWAPTVVSQGIKSRPGSMFAPQGAPGVFGFGDADDDGDVDLLVSGDGDERVFLLEQTSRGQFSTRVLGTALGQAGGMKIGPVGPGGRTALLVTSYEADKVLMFTRR